ncbi:MAG: cell division protein SepF [Actinomycetota bacterium]|nr:cell division protein SepF [Actinomycetota bacterium]
MSALHRLKAYFGMVPADEFDAAEYDDYHSGYSDPGHDARGYDYRVYDSSGYDNSAHRSPGDHAVEHPGTRRPQRAAFDGYYDDNGFATQGGHSAAPRVHPTRAPFWAPSGATDSWADETPVRGSLAIDTAAIKTATINTGSTVRKPATPAPRTGPLAEDEAHPLARIVTLHPHNYNEARPIGERYREGNPVIMNLTEMKDRDAKRLVDFAAGLAFALRGSIDKVTDKVFLLSPPNVDVSAEDRRRIAEGRFFN